MSPTLEEANMRNEVVCRIKSVVNELWPEAKVSCYIDSNVNNNSCN